MDSLNKNVNASNMGETNTVWTTAVEVKQEYISGGVL